jgi:hypothetical protein
MGLIYDSGDSESLKAALSANLTAATTVLEKLGSASDRLIAGLGTGELSGEGYAAVDALFSQVIKPSVTRAKSEIDSISGELEKYAWEDSKVSRFGILKEDELTKQLTATKKQRDATEHQIEVHTHAIDSSAAVPGLVDALEIKNKQLELILNQLENDIHDLEDRLKALRGFAAATASLFGASLSRVAAATRDTIVLLNDLSAPGGGLSTIVGGAGAGLGTAATRRRILDYLSGGKLTADAEGRVRWGNRYLYDTTDHFIFRRGNSYNQATKTRIDHYKRPVKAGAKGLAAPIDDFRGWKGVSTVGKFGKGLGAAGTILTVGLDVNEHFGEGGDGNVGKFAVDAGVDLAGAAAAAGAGAVFGSLILPPLGTVVGAGIGILANVVANAPLFGGKSMLDHAKDWLNDAFGL